MLEQQRVEAFTKLRDATQYNGMTLTPDQFQAMQDLVEGYIHTYNIEPATMKTPGVRGKTGWVKDLATGGKGKIWSLQYDPEGKYMKLGVNTLEPDQVQVILAAGTQSASTQVHAVLNTPMENPSMVSMEVKVDGEALKFFGASGRAQRVMAEDLIAQKGITLGKLLAYAKASAEPDIAKKFLEKYFEIIEFIGLEEISAEEWKLLEEYAIRMNGTKTMVPDYCADKLARLYMKKPVAQILTDLQTLYKRASQPLMRITLLAALGQKMRGGEQVSVPELKALWRLGREEVFVLLQYLPKEQRSAIME